MKLLLAAPDSFFSAAWVSQSAAWTAKVLKMDRTSPKRDRYGRLVCKVTVAGRDVGLEQIRGGMAWWYRKYSKEQSQQDQADYEQAETMAKLHRFGLWGDANPSVSGILCKRGLS